MSELTPLREAVDTLADQNLPPDFYYLKQRATRRRRMRVVLAAAAAAVLVGSTAAVPGLVDERRAAPVDEPTTDDEWPLERIRAEGIVEEEDVTQSGITVRLYGRCDEGMRAPEVPESVESVCGPNVDGPIRQAHSHFTLEVSQDGQSALFSGEGEWPYVVTAFGEDAVIVLDGEPGIGVDPADPSYGRYRLLRADGTETPLRLAADPAPAVPGPDVVVIDRAEYEGEGIAAMQFAFRLDEQAGTLQLLDVPRNDLGMVGNSWGPNTDEALWFVQAIDCRVDRIVDGTVESHRACGDDFKGHWYDSLVSVDAAWIPDGWLTPDRMVVLQKSGGELTLHVSLDQGATWNHIPVSDEQAIAEALTSSGLTRPDGEG